jgi:phage shock protein E
MGLFSFLKGKPKADLVELIRSGAKLIDVRSKSEFASGHAKGTTNVPLEQIGSKASSWKKDEPIILCCRSGMRSGAAVSQLKGAGFTNVHNAGSWNKMQTLIQQK